MMMTVSPTIGFSSALALVAFTLLSSSAEAQLLFGSRLGQAHYQGDDTKIIMRVGADNCATRRMVSPAPGPTRRPETAEPSLSFAATSAAICLVAMLK